MKVIIMYYIKIKWIFTFCNIIIGQQQICGSDSIFIIIQICQYGAQLSLYTNPSDGGVLFLSIIRGCILEFSEVKSKMMENEWISDVLFLLFCKLEDTHAIICRLIFFTSSSPHPLH